MTGDTPYDAEAARAAGVSALGVLTGGFSYGDLEEAGCLAAIKQVREMQAFLTTPQTTSSVETQPAARLIAMRSHDITIA